jgi:hypothetical protein
VVPSQATTAVAIDLADGSRRWSRVLDWDQSAIGAVQGGATLGGTVSGEYCYLQDANATIAIELRTGAVRWSSKQTPPPANAGPTPSMSVANGALVLSNFWEYLALDTDSGAQLWAKPDENVSNFVARADRVFTLAPHAAIRAFDTRTGDVVWSTPGAGPDMFIAGTTELTMSASSSLLAAPLAIIGPGVPARPLASGVLVLSAADGRPLWARQHPEQSGPPAWQVLAAGGAVYGLDPASGSLYAFPPTVT